MYVITTQENQHVDTCIDLTAWGMYYLQMTYPSSRYHSVVIKAGGLLVLSYSNFGESEMDFLNFKPR